MPQNTIIVTINNTTNLKLHIFLFFPFKKKYLNLTYRLSGTDCQFKKKKKKKKNPDCVFHETFLYKGFQWTCNHIHFIHTWFPHNTIRWKATLSTVESQKGAINIQDVPFRTRAARSLYKVYGNSALLVLNRTSLYSDSALLALNWRYSNHRGP